MLTIGEHFGDGAVGFRGAKANAGEAVTPGLPDLVLQVRVFADRLTDLGAHPWDAGQPCCAEVADVGVFPDEFEHGFTVVGLDDDFAFDLDNVDRCPVAA